MPNKDRIANSYTQIALVVFATLIPTNLYASDFAPLMVGVTNIAFAGIIIGLGVKATAIKKTKGFKATLPFLICIFVLAFLGVAIVIDESSHMGSSDFIGMLLLVIIPGIISLLAAICVNQNKNTNDP